MANKEWEQTDNLVNTDRMPILTRTEIQSLQQLERKELTEKAEMELPENQYLCQPLVCR